LFKNDLLMEFSEAKAGVVDAFCGPTIRRLWLLRNAKVVETIIETDRLV